MAEQAQIQEARELVDRVVKHARADEYKALLKIDAQPETETLLALLPDRDARRAEVHLNGARTWRHTMNNKAKEKLDSAQTELDELDLQLARGILRKLDWEILYPEELERYNELMLSLEARTWEQEQIESQIEDIKPEEGERKNRRFWRS